MTSLPSLRDLIDAVRHDAGTEESLALLVAAAAASTQLEDSTDALLGHFVDCCRRDGRSWAEIGTAVAATRQAVHSRFASAVAAHLFAASPSPTFEQFTERARHVVTAASQAAAATGQDTVTTVHLLLGLFSEPDGLAGRVLAAMNVSEQGVRAAIWPAHGETADDGAADSSNALAAPGGAAGPVSPEDGTAESRVAFDHDARHALQRALAFALQFGHSYIGTEHILLGLYWDEENQNLAAKILAQAGAPEKAARAHITEMLRGFSMNS
jgi:ATP-dependent Clp protease ATP-binding subunit ClpA